MKYLLTLQLDLPFAPGTTCIPWNHGAAYTAWMYRVLNAADVTLGDRIHQTPVIAGEKTSIRPFVAI
ncbi:MAG: hypothetical protein ACYCOU_26855 [Sulfobacillus sp.]